MKKKEVSEVSAKSTKDQILLAYNEVLAQLQQKELPLSEVQQVVEKEKVLGKSSQISTDSIVLDLGSLKSKVIQQLDTLSSHLLNEFQKLADITAAIIIEQKHLQDLYGIQESAYSLAALIQARDLERIRFDEEMQQKKATLEADSAAEYQKIKQVQEEFDRQQKENKASVERLRQREEEDYIYNRDITRRKEQDAYVQFRAREEQEHNSRLQELEAREKRLAEQEKEVIELRYTLELHPELLQKAVLESEERVRADMSKTFNMEKTLLKKDYESQLQLKTQTLESMVQRLKEQDDLMKELTARSDLATKQVQEIACKALESSAQRFVFPNTEAA